MSAVDTVVARTSSYLAQIPDDQLGGGPTVTDALDTLSDAELVTTAQAVAVTAQKADDPAIRDKAVRVLKAAQVVADGREKARANLAAARPYPTVFASSTAGAKLAAVAARRDRLGQAGGSGAPVRRAVGPLTYYNLWVAQGKWGRQGGGAGGTDPAAAHFGIKGGPSNSQGAAVAFDARPRDAIEAKAIGHSDPLRLQGLRGLGSLAGLNLGKFFSNLVGDVAPFASLAAGLIPGASGILNTIGAAAGAAQQPKAAQAPTYGPAPLPPQQPARASGFPAWGWAAVAAGGLLVLGSRK